jgi:hypothetical protein
MQIRIRVDIGDGPKEVATNLFNVISWERKYKRRAGDLAQGIGAEDLAYLAFEASKTAGIVVPAVFDDYAKRIITLDVVSEDDTNPTHGALTAGA